MSESFKKKEGIRSQGPFPFINNKLEHPLVKCSLLFLIVLVISKLAPTKLLSGQKFIQIGFYTNTGQRPILKEIKLILNNKIREWINIRRIINRYLQSVEHQLT